MGCAAGDAIFFAGKADWLPLSADRQLARCLRVRLVGWRSSTGAKNGVGADIVDAVTHTRYPLLLLANLVVVRWLNSDLRSPGGTIRQLLALGHCSILPDFLV
ncbi:hypothetical protein D3C81_1120480 [compost metagenome]